MIALFFDTETTGVKSYRDPGFKPSLVQLGCILQDTETKRVLAEVNLIANQYPDTKIPAGAVAVHGISDDMAHDYGVDPKLIDIVFAELVNKANVLVAHNIAFDIDVITDNMPLSLKAIKDNKKLKEFCTMDNNVMIVKAPLTEKQQAYFTSRGEKPDKPYKVPNLTETYKHYFKEDFIGAHDAMADIRACRDIYFAMEGK